MDKAEGSVKTMGEMRKLPVGIDDFEKLRRENFYYIDKTRMIQDLMSNLGKVNLFTRPRRFGKTLNMSMLDHRKGDTYEGSRSGS